MRIWSSRLRVRSAKASDPLRMGEVGMDANLPICTMETQHELMTHPSIDTRGSGIMAVSTLSMTRHWQHINAHVLALTHATSDCLGANSTEC